MFRHESVNSTRKFTIVAEIVSLLKNIYIRDAPFSAVFKVKPLAVLFSAYPREMKHIPRNLNLPPFWRCLRTHLTAVELWARLPAAVSGNEPPSSPKEIEPSIVQFLNSPFFPPLSCIRLARGKFELTNQRSAGGKNFSVLTSS